MGSPIFLNPAARRITRHLMKLLGELTGDPIKMSRCVPGMWLDLTSQSTQRWAAV